MKKKLAIWILLIIAITVACEEIIEIDLEGADSGLVIEGIITNLEGPYVVRLSKTTDYFDPSEYPMVSGAQIIITDDLGQRDTLTEISAGVYHTTHIQGEEGRLYNLRVRVEEEEYTGSSFLPGEIRIDSLELEYYPETYYYEEAYWLHCHYMDPVGEGNYYRAKMYKNDTIDKLIYLMDDKFIDGNPVDLFFWGGSFFPGDTGIVELLTMDENLYDYFYTLFELIYSGGSGAYSTPANPNTNLSGGALGYFGAFAISSDTILIPDFPE